MVQEIKKKSNEEESAEPAYYDPKVELKKIKTDAETQAGWQKIVNDSIGNIVGFLERRNQLEYQSAITISKWTYILVGIFFLVISALTFVGIVSGDALVFLTGILVGYMLSLISARPKRESAQ